MGRRCKVRIVGRLPRRGFSSIILTITRRLFAKVSVRDLSGAQSIIFSIGNFLPGRSISNEL